MRSADKKAKNYIKRFSVFRVIEHWAGAALFFILAVTGLPQKFHDYELSSWIIINLGGIDITRIIHRYAGAVFALLIFQHLIVACSGVISGKWRASLAIGIKDFKDAMENLMFYFGITNRPALCDRYDYKQKFEYWGVVIGGLSMLISGLVLWFPSYAAQLFPGEFIPAAKALHTNEALLAFVVIVTWHIYNSIFSPEVFPLDTTILTGKITLERMEREHPLELARMGGEKVGKVLPCKEE